MQKVVEGQETESRGMLLPEVLVSMMAFDQVEPVQESAFPLMSTAMQSEAVGQETELRWLVPSMEVALDQEKPSQESALPLPSTAMQNVVVGQETEVRP